MQMQVHHDNGHNWQQLMASTLSKWSPCWHGLWQQWQPHHFRELNNLLGECGQDCAEADQAVIHRTDRGRALQVPPTQQQVGTMLASYLYRASHHSMGSTLAIGGC